MCNLEDVWYIANLLNIKFDKFSANDLFEGINVEMEHGTKNINTNITNDDLIMTSKIALAHLNEFPNYYNKEYGIKIFEQFLKSKLKGK